MTSKFLLLGENQFQESFVIKKNIGCGIYSIMDRDTNQLFICKVFSKISYRVERILKEQEMFRVLNRGSAMKLMRVMEDQRHFYMIFRHSFKVAETITKRLLRTSTSKKEEQLKEFLRTILIFLFHCHKFGIVMGLIKFGSFLLFDNLLSPLATDLVSAEFYRGEPLSNITFHSLFSAPEVEGRVYVPASDVFNAGILLAYLPPNTRMNYSSLICKMIDQNPQTRISGLDALSHDWLVDEELLYRLPQESLTIKILLAIFWKVHNIMVDHPIVSVANKTMREVLEDRTVGQALEKNCKSYYDEWKWVNNVIPLFRTLQFREKQVGRGDAIDEELIIAAGQSLLRAINYDFQIEDIEESFILASYLLNIGRKRVVESNRTLESKVEILTGLGECYISVRLSESAFDVLFQAFEIASLISLPRKIELTIALMDNYVIFGRLEEAIGFGQRVLDSSQFSPDQLNYKRTLTDMVDEILGMLSYKSKTIKERSWGLMLRCSGQTTGIGFVDPHWRSTDFFWLPQIIDLGVHGKKNKENGDHAETGDVDQDGDADHAENGDADEGED